MDKAELLVIVGADKAVEVESFLKEVASPNWNAGERRMMDKVTAERDRLLTQVETLKTDNSGSKENATQVRDLTKQVTTLTTERDKLLPIVQAHQEGVLRSSIVETARLSDDLIADALVTKLGLALGDDGKLSEAHVKVLTDWAADPANAGRVKPVEGEKTDAAAAAASTNLIGTSRQVGGVLEGGNYPTAPAGNSNLSAAGAGNVPEAVQKWTANMPAAQKAAVLAAYNGNGAATE